MTIFASTVNSAGSHQYLCKSSSGHFYMGGPRSAAFQFKDHDDYVKFVAHLKELNCDDPRVEQYDIDVFGLVTDKVQLHIPQ